MAENIFQKLTEIQVGQANAIGRLGDNFERVSTQLTGLTSAVYTQSISQIVPTFDGEPSHFKNWIKWIEKYSILTKINDNEIPIVAYQTCHGPVSDYIERHLDECRKAHKTPDWPNLKQELKNRFSEINDQSML